MDQAQGALGLVFAVLVAAAFWVVLITLVAIRWNQAESGSSASRKISRTASAGLEELHGLFSPGKRQELEQRRVESSLRQEEEAGGRSIDSIDLERGTVKLDRRSDQNPQAQGKW